MENKYCCRLATAIGQDRLLCETSNFFVIPTLGSMGIEGYLLIIPKEHHHAMGMIPENHLPELNNLISDVKKIIKSVYGLPTLLFEHGPRVGNLDSGQSVDHAHLHIVPGIDITENWAVDLMMRLGDVGQFYRVERVEGLERGADMIRKGTSYLYVENTSGIRLLSEQNFHRPSQYFRTMVASKIGSSVWDWRQHPDYNTLEKTVGKLKEKF